jgi:Tol biopolymer transport system component/predicted Ser/Thr protein kinase
MPLVAGTQLGPYEVVGPLGAGGMGEVYRALDRRLGRDVALKVLPEAFETRPDRRARFEREARAAGALTHPNILAVHDMGRHEGQPYVVFELLDGTTLRSRLRHGDRLPLRKCLEIAAQVAHGLDAAHAKGIVHRDLKPENLLITTDGVVKILDFGLAKLQDEPEVIGASSASTQSEAPWQTEAGSLLGTAAYMSPEQVRGHPVDHRSDVFALGAVLHEALAGAPAFLKATRPATLLAILGEDAPDLAQARPGVPPPVRGLVRRCLEKDPAERFQSARDLAFALEGLLSGVDTLEESRGLAVWTRRTLPRARRWRVPAAVGCLVALAGVGGWLLRGRGAIPALGMPRQLTSDPGWEAEPALSPDGTFVAYTSDRSGNEDIWVTDARGGSAVQLTSDPASDTRPAWLPDGSAIVFASARGGSTGIWRVPRLGGAAVLVAPDGDSPAVSPDGTLIAFSRPGPSGATRIAIAPLAATGLASLVTGDEDGLWDHENPAWSPDGVNVCYSDFRDLWVIAAAGGAARRLTTAQASDDHPAWSPDGREVVFSSAREGTAALWAVPAAGGEPRRLTLGTGPETEPSLSRDGHRLAYSTSVSGGDVVLVDPRSRQVHRVPGVRDESSPALSPDGRTLVFSSNREGSYDLWAQALDAGRPVGPAQRLTDTPGSESRPAFSADGRWLAFGRVLGGQRDIWVMPAAGGLARRVTEHPAPDLHPAWSPDGAHLAYISERAGHMDVWTVAMAGGVHAGEPVPLTSDAGVEYSPSWSPDGRFIAFTRYEGGTLGIWLVPAVGSDPPRRLAGAPEAFMVRWIETGLLSAARWGSEGVSLRRIDPGSGQVDPFDPPLILGSTSLFDVSRDGGSVASADVVTRGDVWVLERGAQSGR